ncbi:(E3-independent) E2 ubiquitin-conjugating enzyme UBE2O [Haematobia irritans]|uniref:(E3-independent) E2 ubiquitin-conjugating enzyme UBE2O n=1 Tax=Haematobia irritans TaxID=7368 RepID=UPI003F4FF37D
MEVVDTEVPKDGPSNISNIPLEENSENNKLPQHESSSSTDSNSSVKTKESDAINKSGASPKLQIITENNSIVLSSPQNGNDSSSSAIVAEEGTPADNMYFYEDEVFRIDKKGRVKFGCVLQTAADQDDNDEEFGETLSKGEVRVAWYPEDKDRVHAENTIGLVDRTLMPGDVVRRLLRGKETQRGYCRDINMRADVKVLGTKYVIKNVNAERLRTFANWQVDSAVYLNSWVGSISEVEKKAVIRSINGCRIEISSSHFHLFEDFEGYKRGNFAPAFYPGNTIIGSLPPMENIKILTPDIPLSKNKKGKPLLRKFKIESIYTASVWVHWQCKALSDEASLQSITSQPPSRITGEDLNNLKRLNLFESLMLQIDDQCYLTFSSCDTIMKKSDWENEQSEKYKIIFEEQMKLHQQFFFNPPTLNGPAAGGSAGGLHHNYEKFKKKLNLGLDDKATIKSKRNSLKNGKYNNSHPNRESLANLKTTSANEKEDENEWISMEEDVDDEDDFDPEIGLKPYNLTDDALSTTTTMSTGSSPSRTSPVHLTKRQLKKKARKNYKKPFLCENKKEFCPKEGEDLATEALLIYSTATVVWQDGTIECDIPSTELYPIHHIDNHEFFPGDFVISGIEESDVNYRDYGVIQTVDHEGRIARVKWFTTYTSADEPKPSYKGESEVSVYDLKDHPDFQYRPGTMVIRVANFVGDDAKCTAGQIIDNCIDGHVKVWWVDGHISMCWPQDLFEVGQYDQGVWERESEDSWETESENSEYGGGAGSSLKLSMSESHVLSNIEKARVAVARLEEIFNLSPNLQNPEVMKKLLTVYKGCRYLDRLLNTNFFHEDNFMGLIERVRRVGKQSLCDRAQDQKNRLFNDGAQAIATSPSPTKSQQHIQYYSAIVAVNSCGQKQSMQSGQQILSGLSSKEYAPKVLFNISSTPFKCASNHATNATMSSTNIKKRCSPVAAREQRKSDKVPIEEQTSETNCDDQHYGVEAAATVQVVVPQFEISPNKNKQYNAEKNQLLNSAMLNIEKAFEKTSLLKTFTDDSSGNAVHNISTSQDDSGNYSRNENCDGSSTSCTSSSDLTNIDTNNSITKVNDNQKSISCSSIEIPEDVAPEMVCVRLCSLLKEQLVKCLDEIREKYYKDDQVNLSDIFDIDQMDDETLETVIDFQNLEDQGKETKDNATDVLPLSMENQNNDNDNDGGEDLDINMQLTTTKESVVNSNDAGETSTPPSNSATDSSITKAIEAGLHPIANASTECFQVLPAAPKNHKFHLTIFHPNNTQQYYKAVQREHRMLKNSLPPGVWVRIFEDRMDLLSVMIEGPKKTPYEDGMFFFDIQLGRDYPKDPPLCHYISYCSDRLNPNLYEDGKVCVSLLGTWTGKESEMWGPKSTLLQVIVSIQGLILVPEPYFNEAGYDKQKDTQQGRENSRMYNEMVMIKMVQATTKLIQNPSEIFRNEIIIHFKKSGMQMYERIKGWMELSKESHRRMLPNTSVDTGKEDHGLQTANATYNMPDFPLVPASRGFCLSLAGLLETFRNKLSSCIENVVIADVPKTSEE